MLPRLACAVAAAVLLGGAGCGGKEPPPSRACLEGAAPLLAALRSAPSPVRLSDGTPLSRCVERARGDADLQTLGIELTAAASDLAARAGARDTAALRLGYLVGAAERGAEHTNGIHAELVDRLRNAAGIDGVPAGRRAAIARGRAAGRAAG